MATRRIGATGRTVGLAALGLVTGFAVVLVGYQGLREARGTAGTLSRAMPAAAALGDAERANLEGQMILMAVLQTDDPTQRSVLIEEALAAAEVLDGAWSEYLRHAFGSARERLLQETFEAATERNESAAAALITTPTSDPAYSQLLTEEVTTHNELIGAIDELQAIYRPMVERDATDVRSQISETSRDLVLGYVLAAALFAGVSIVLVTASRAEQRAIAREAARMAAAGRRAEFERALQAGLEMAPSEDTALDIIGRALAMSADGVAAELLLSDSSRAHFSQVTSTVPSDGPACDVYGPPDCPAAASGQLRVFEDSRRIDACTHLRGREPAVRAVCVPVSIAGRTTGVIHAEHDVMAQPPEELAHRLELVARKGGDRLGALRVLARTEAQAQVDPLTGLPNRRTLENRFHDQLIGDEPFVVAFADLDHFKNINDTHGHDVGDHALRLFARVLRDSVRPRDLVARYGGEEFVAVLPNCALSDAEVVAHRIRSRLATTIEHSTVPAFTVSIGLASAEPGDALSEVIASADAAMLRAKALGRDRVLIAGDPFDPSELTAGHAPDGHALAAPGAGDTAEVTT